MFQAGDSLEVGSAGTRVVFRRTALETGGRAVVLEVLLPPNGLVPRLHVHPRQTERVEVLAGSVGTLVGGRRAVVGPGVRLTIDPGVPHRLWNAGEETAHLVVELAPALRTESLLAALSAGDGRRPRPFLIAAAAHRETVRPMFLWAGRRRRR